MQKMVTNAYHTISFELYNSVGRRRHTDPAPRKEQHRVEGMWRKPMFKQHAPTLSRATPWHTARMRFPAPSIHQKLYHKSYIIY